MENHRPPPHDPSLEPDESQSRALIRRPSYGYGYPAAYGYGYGAQNDSDSESGGLLEYWRILRHQKATWLIFTFIGAVIGFLATIPQTPIYQSHSSIEIQGLNENFMNMRQNTEVYEAGSDPSEIPTQIKIIQSEAVVGAAVDQIKSAPPTVKDPSRLAYWRHLLRIADPDQTTLLNQQLAYTVKSFKARASGQTRVIEVTADSADPSLAPLFINTITTKFIDQNLESRWKSTEKTAQWLSHQLDDMRVKLERSEDNLQQYARQSGLLFTDEKTNVSEEKLKMLQAELSAASAARIARQSTFELAQSSSPDALPDVLNDATLRDTAAKIRDLHSQIADLRTIYAPDYDKVRRLQAELSVLQSTFEHDRTAILGRIKNEFQDSLRREQLLQAAYNAQTQQVTGEGEKTIQYNILKREVDSNRQLYDSMLAQLKQSSIASAMRASNIRVVDTAKIAVRPYKPDRQQSTGIGALAGVFLGAAFIIMRSRADTSIQQPGETSALTNMPELAIIPAGKADRLKSLLPQGNLQDRLELEAWQRKPSPVAESFRSALISILFTPEHTLNSKLQTLVLTSPGPAEGKSTVSSNLAIAIAEVGRKVLLIDGDMRRPRQHDVFSIDNSLGLSSVLREKAELNGDPTLGGAIQTTPIPGLSILPSGPHTSSSTNLLINPHMAHLLAYLKDHYDLVLIDTPPMLQIPDARVVGRLVDSVIMVVRANKTTRTAVLAACQRFSEDGTKILGTILNDWNPKTAPDGYYGYSNYRNYNYYRPDNKS